MPMPVMTLANATATGVSPIGMPVATVCAVTPNMDDVFKVREVREVRRVEEVANG